MSEAVDMDASLAQENCLIGKGNSPMKATSELSYEIGSQSAFSEPLEQKDENFTRKEENGPMRAGVTKSDNADVEILGITSEDSTKKTSCEQLGPPAEDATVNTSIEQFESPSEDAIGKSLTPEQTKLELNHEVGSVGLYSEQMEQKHDIRSEDGQVERVETTIAECDSNHYIVTEPLQLNQPQGQLVSAQTINSNPVQLGPLPYNASENSGLEKLQTPHDDEANNPRRLGNGGKRTSARKGKRALKLSLESTRVLRSRIQEKPKDPESSNTFADHGPNEEKKRKKRKKKHNEVPVNEFAKIRNHLRYLLNRMNYEKNLIDAYSGEGWKGQSLEKVKLEKELERAKSEILRRKLKLRDLFQRLDLSCAEGRFPESLFDSQGQIDCEDIFCAKCGSKDAQIDNDIILCDGACERGFHQFCLQPPLLKEQIPPGDEGWLCPGCDCKIDCIKTLNESQGTNLSITDSWEKVFPEAATGNKLDDSIGLPSDDSEDDDYNPSDSEVDEKVQGDEVSSDESDFSSASDDFGASLKNNQYQGLPSDDSEDDDYDPNAQDIDEQAKPESSSSDFTSDSEDFNAALSDHRRSGGDSDGKRSKLGEPKFQLPGKDLNVELVSLFESEPGQGDSAPISGKRHVERLDYKKLHDEAYGNTSSDSSDEEWMDADDAPKKRKSDNGKAVLVSSNGKTPALKHSTDTEATSHDEKESELTFKRRGLKKLYVEGINESPSKSYKGSPEPGSSGKSTTKSASKKLGEAVTRRLFESFKENLYPDGATKEDLANELGITSKQVNKWFVNTRWSFRNSPRKDSHKVDSTTNKGTCGGRDLGAGKLVTVEGQSQKSTTPESGKDKDKLDHPDAENTSHSQKVNEIIPKRRGRKELDVEVTNKSAAQIYKALPEPGSSGKCTTKSARKGLGESVTRRLYESFKENQYPTRAAKEYLANELGIKLQQVSKWFANTRWSFHHPSGVGSHSLERTPSNATHIGGDPGTRNLVTKESQSQKSMTPKSRKKKGKLDHHASDCSPSAEVAPTRSERVESLEAPEAMGAQVKLAEASEARKSSRGRPIRRKSMS